MDIELSKVDKKYNGPGIVVATGPSLTKEAAAIVHKSGLPTVIVSDAYRLLPDADYLYSCDYKWWRWHKGARQFQGEKWSSHDETANDKRDAQNYVLGLNLVRGEPGNTFSTDPEFIRYGNNSGFQAINLAILLGMNPIILVGFNMQGGHFFGDHKFTGNYDAVQFVPDFEAASATLPEGLRIINATPDSALTMFPYQELEKAITDAKSNGSTAPGEPERGEERLRARVLGEELAPTPGRSASPAKDSSKG